MLRAIQLSRRAGFVIHTREDNFPGKIELFNVNHRKKEKGVKHVQS